MPPWLFVMVPSLLVIVPYLACRRFHLRADAISAWWILALIRRPEILWLVFPLSCVGYWKWSRCQYCDGYIYNCIGIWILIGFRSIVQNVYPCSQTILFAQLMVHHLLSRQFEDNSALITIVNNLQAGSLGCAPTPSQYFARLMSSLTSLNLRCEVFDAVDVGAREEGSSSGSCGRGLKVPRTSIGLELRPVLWG